MRQHGHAPFLECSSRGDFRFSAFGARLKKYHGRSIENVYQGAKIIDGVYGLTWREAKGRKAENQEEVTRLYAELWDQYIAENPELLDVLVKASGLSDIFADPTRGVCQATELWRIRCAEIERRSALAPRTAPVDG